LHRFVTFGLPAVMLVAVGGCAPSYSPNTYNSTAVQQANKVDQGVIVGVRQVGVSAAGTTGAVAGGATGGILGSQIPGSSFGTAVGTVGGTLIGGLVGTAAEHTVDDTTAYEYIVRKSDNTMISVAQKDKTPMALGQHVLVISGNQARIVPDYTVAAGATKQTPTPMPAALPDVLHPEEANAALPVPAPSAAPAPPGGVPTPSGAAPTPSGAAPTPGAAPAPSPEPTPTSAEAPAPAGVTEAPLPAPTQAAPATHPTP
jgi:outer membrane lipoprotein SlyB